MHRKKATPDQVKQVAILREAGWTLTTIADRTGLSLSTVQRVLRRTGTKAGEAEAALVDAARKELRESISSDANLHQLYAEIISDSISQIRLARAKSAEIVEALYLQDTQNAPQLMRAIAAHATATKLHADTFRSLLPRPIDQEALPELIIRAMTQDDVERLRQEQKEMDIEMGDASPDIEEDEAEDSYTL